MRVTRWTRLPLALGLVFTACDRSASGPKGAPGAPAAAGEPQRLSAAATEAPKLLLYPNDRIACTKGAALAPEVPTYGGGAPFSYKVKPDLPDGLLLDVRTGAISGTPTKVTPKATYEITGTNPLGSITTTVTLAVNDAVPGAAPEITLPPFVSVDSGTPRASTKDLGEGHTYEWTLTGGEILSGQGTPSITFKAVEEGTLQAQVKVSNSGGSVTGRGETRAVAKPEASMSLPAAVRPNEDWMTVSVKPQEGATYAWTILPGSSGARIVDGQGTNTMRYATNPAFGTFQIQVTVTNQAGESATAIGAVQVLP